MVGREKKGGKKSQSCLKNLCRLCGRRCLNREQIRKGKKPTDANDFQKDILIICHVNIGYDIVDFHSP